MPKVKDDGIVRWSTKTKKGHEVSVFFDKNKGLFVADLIHKNGEGGNEFVRIRLDEGDMLSHCTKRKEVRKREKRQDGQVDW